MRTLSTIAVIAVASLLLAGCSSPAADDNGQTPDGSGSTNDPAGTGSQGSHPDNPYSPPSSTTQVFGSGATFPKPLLESWGIQYSHEESKVQVSYGGGGSGKGISDITKKDVFFGGSDAPMSASEKSAANAGGNTILQFPETLGAVAIVYNVKDIPNGLKLDGETLGKIYSGAIKRWDDDAIQALNPGVDLPDSSIAIVYRSDSSGTTFVFTDYLARTSPTFAGAVSPGANKKPDWTKSSATQLSGNGNDGVGSLVKTTPNSIGYVELAYVDSLALKAAQMKSHDGDFLAPTTEGASKAAASKAATLPAPDGDWSAVTIVDAAGEGAYPISSFSYIMVYDDLAAYGSKATANQQAAFKAWMWWCLHDGQDLSEPLGYARLPESVVTIGEAALASLK